MRWTVLEQQIARKMQHETTLKRMASIVGCDSDKIKFEEVDGDGTLIFSCDSDPSRDLVILNVDIFEKTITNGSAKLSLTNMDVMELRKPLTRKMIDHLRLAGKGALL